MILMEAYSSNHRILFLKRTKLVLKKFVFVLGINFKLDPPLSTGTDYRSATLLKKTYFQMSPLNFPEF